MNALEQTEGGDYYDRIDEIDWRFRDLRVSLVCLGAALMALDEGNWFEFVNELRYAHDERRPPAKRP